MTTWVNRSIKQFKISNRGLKIRVTSMVLSRISTKLLEIFTFENIVLCSHGGGNNLVSL